jgi:hypothetical protein
MAGKARPSLRAKTLYNVERSNLSKTDKECIKAVFERFEEVKHGKWIYNVKYCSCSICAGKRFNLLLGTDAEFCPYCGAKMYGGDTQ